jgi:hypothetical protein
VSEEERYVEEAETQYNEWKGTVALDEPHDETCSQFFDLDRSDRTGLT